jgi:hypothetical protein
MCEVRRLRYACLNISGKRYLDDRREFVSAGAVRHHQIALAGVACWLWIPTSVATTLAFVRQCQTADGRLIMIDTLNDLLAWLRQNMDVLGWLAGGVVFVVGAIWGVLRPKPPLQVPSSTPPVIILDRERSQPSLHLSKVMPLACEGQNTVKNLPDPWFTIFACVFTLIWCSIIFYGVSSSFAAIGFARIDFIGLLILPIFCLVPMYMFYMGSALLFDQLASAFGRVKVVVTPDVLIVITTLWGAYLRARHALSSEWKFDGSNMVSKRDGLATPLPEMPEFVKGEVVAYLKEHWH